MNLGFIGTGKIASSVITGICRSKITYKKIIISPRNRRIARSLKKKFKKIIIAKDNQQIIDKSDWVFSSWRNHYHALLHGVNENLIKRFIFDGKSMSTVSYTHLRAHET